jgi:carbon storage regulator CsrA
MLVLSRKVNEQIVVGDSIRITFAAHRGLEVRIGIEAPPGVKILRGELLTRSTRPNDRKLEDGRQLDIARRQRRVGRDGGQRHNP